MNDPNENFRIMLLKHSIINSRTITMKLLAKCSIFWLIFQGDLYINEKRLLFKQSLSLFNTTIRESSILKILSLSLFLIKWEMRDLGSYRKFKTRLFFQT